MLLTITTTHNPAGDLGYLLYKHPAKVQTFSLKFGKAHVFYPEVSDERCMAALLVEVDPVNLTRRKETAGFALQPYVNDRPYAASSFFSVALQTVFRTAMNGICAERQALADTPIPLTATLAMVPGSDGLIERLFAPLGYRISAERAPLDPAFPQWGASRYVKLTLTHTIRLADLLNHLYVLIPVLDDEKHYWVGNDEVEKLLRRGGEWLANHPAQEEIAHRYLKRRRRLTRLALAQLTDSDDTPDDEEAVEMDTEEKVGLHKQRLNAVTDVLLQTGAKRIVDVGCGEGKLLRGLLQHKQFSEILGMDVSHVALDRAEEKLERLPDRLRERIKLIHGSLMYRDRRIEGFDAAAVVEVVEHLDPPRLAAFERVLFDCARPQTIALTTPNSDYNVMWPALPAGRFRHRDHRFEWSRAEFEAWCAGICERFGYGVEIRPIGPLDPTVGAPSQMAIFTKAEG